MLWTRERKDILASGLSLGNERNEWNLVYVQNYVYVFFLWLQEDLRDESSVLIFDG